MQEKNIYDKLNKILRRTIENNTILTEIYDAHTLSRIIFDFSPINMEHKQ